jgi:hypothetical protein
MRTLLLFPAQLLAWALGLALLGIVALPALVAATALTTLADIVGWATGHGE